MKVSRRQALVLTSSVLFALIAGCSGRDINGLDETARARIEPMVFDEDYGDDVYFQAYADTYFKSVSIDSVAAHENLIYAHNSYKSLRAIVPGVGSPLGGFAGGVLTSVGVRDFRDFNALTFYARSSVNSTLNVVGFGDDNTGTSLYTAERHNIALTPGWTFVVVPIPSPRKLIAERGLFFFAEGAEPLSPSGHALWFDDIRYANLSNVEPVSASMPTMQKQYLPGSTATIEGTTTTFSIDGAQVVVDHKAACFDYFSSNPEVAVVDGPRIRVVGAGIDTITAKLDTLDVQGQVIITSFAAPPTAAPVPAVPASDVISLYSDTYGTWPVNSWNPHWQWSTTQNENYVIAGNTSLMYTTLNFVGIVFTTSTIDASAMTHLHLDVYAPVGSVFKVKLVAFNANNGYLTGQAERTFDAASTPAFAAGAWTSLDIPLADFSLTVPVDHLAQLVLSTSNDPATATPLVLVDNIYFHR